MANQTSRLIVELVDRVTAPARALSGVVGRLTQSTGRFSQQQRQMMAPINSAVGRVVALGAAYVSVTKGIGGTIGAAIEFESAMADVKKVVDFPTPLAFQTMSQELIDLSKRIPLAATGLAQIAAEAGAAGMQAGELMAFTEMAAKVGVAFDITAESAGNSLAKLKTALQLNVADTGILADAINHLSNGMASTAPEILDYMNRVGSTGKQFGFTAGQTAAIGSAMIASGAEAEVAATSFRNVGKALTKGSAATKAQLKAYNALGLDSVKVSKAMQKNATATLRDVLERVKKLPRYMQAATLSQLFGDEARAFAPLVESINLYDEALGYVDDRLKYVGSSQREYESRSKTTANSFQLLKNNLSAVGIELGSRFLPMVNDAVGGILEVFRTLGERVTIFDRIGQSIKGFLNGLGMDGASLATFVKDLKEFILGTADGEKAADEMGRIFLKFKEYGASVRELTNAIRESAIGQFIGSLSGYGFKLMLTTVAFTMAAGAIMALGRALMFLSGASAAIAILKGVVRAGAGLAGLFGAGAAATATAAGAGGAAAGAGAAAGGGIVATLTRALPLASRLSGYMTLAYGAYKGGQVVQEVGEIATGKYYATQDPQAIEGMRREVAELEARIAAVREKSVVPEMADTLVAPMQNQIDILKQRIDASTREIGASITENLSVTATPKVDTSSIDNAIAKVNQLSKYIGGLIGAAGTLNIPSPATAAVAGARAAGGAVQRGLTYLVGENGPELFTAGNGGYVHNALRTASMIANSVPAVPNTNWQGSGSGGGSSLSLASGAISIQIHPSPGQSPKEIASEVKRTLSAELNALSRGAFSDGAN